MTLLKDSNTHLNKSEHDNSKSDQERLVMCDLFFDPVDICMALSAIPSQENADENEHEIMLEACVYIDELRARIKKLEQFNLELANESHDLKQRIRGYRKARSM